MEDSEAKIRQQLATAGELFASGKYGQCRKLLAEVKMAHHSIDLNQLIAEAKESPSKAAPVARKIIDALAALAPGPAPRPARITHELHFWNAVVLAQQAGQAEVAELVTEEAVRFAETMRTETILMLLYQLLSAREKAGRLASCLALVAKVEQLAGRTKQLSETEQAFRFLAQVLLTRVLLKLGLVEAGKIAFMMRFNQAPESKEEFELSQINGIGVAVHQQLLHAEIQYHSGSHPQAIRILSELMPQLDSLGRNRDFLKTILDHNMGIILIQYHKSTAAQLLFRKSLKYFSNSEELQNHNQRHSWISKCKENLILAGIVGKIGYGNLYEYMKDCGSFSSFKNSYRKAEICIKHYHELLAEQPRLLPSKEVHDAYEPAYYYPNQPYFQQKGKNKNPNFTNGRAYYRRYVMPEWEGQANDRPMVVTRQNEADRSTEVKQEKEKKKEKSGGRNGKGVKKEEEPSPKEPQSPIADPYKAKLNEVLTAAETYLKKALTFLENERNVIVTLDRESKQLTQQVNEKLHGEYVEYKSSIFSLLSYVQLSQKQWIRALLSADAYLDFARLHQLDSHSPTHQQTFFTVLTYRMEALCELGRMTNAYESMQEAAGVIEYAQKAQVQARSTGSQQSGQNYFEQMSQYGNFYFNLAVLHSRDNKIPEAFQAIQKVMQQLRVVPSSPQARIPLSALELLIHYNLRTGNISSALQLIKRRRILSIPGAIAHHPPTLSITK